METLNKEFEDDFSVLHYIEYAGKLCDYYEVAFHKIFKKYNNGNKLEFFDISEEIIQNIIDGEYDDLAKDTVNKKKQKKKEDCAKYWAKTLNRLGRRAGRLEDEIRQRTEKKNIFTEEIEFTKRCIKESIKREDGYLSTDIEHLKREGIIIVDGEVYYKTD